MSKESTIITNPHNAAAQSGLADIRVARELFRYYLPSDLLAYIDLGSLKSSPTTFVSKKMKTYISDIVYEVKIAGHLGFLSVVIEHKSYPDKWLPLQLHHYIAEAMIQYHKQYPNKKVPLVYGLALYNGEVPYPHDMDVRSLINAPQALIDKYFLKPPQLLDLTQLDNEALKKHTWSGALLLSLKNIFIRDLLTFLKTDLTDIFQEIMGEGGEELVQAMLKYYVGSGDIVNERQFSDYVGQRLSKELGAKVRTLADKWLAEGRVEGWAEGSEQSARRIAENMFALGLGTKEIAQATGLNISVVQSIEKSTQRSTEEVG